MFFILYIVYVSGFFFGSKVERRFGFYLGGRSVDVYVFVEEVVRVLFVFFGMFMVDFFVIYFSGIISIFSFDIVCSGKIGLVLWVFE